MTSPKLLIFDDGAGRFGPMTDLRAAFDLRSGALSSRQRIERALRRNAEALFAPKALLPLIERGGADLIDPDHPELAPDAWLLINGRWPGAQDGPVIAQVPMNSALLQPDGQIVAAQLDHRQAGQLIASNFNAGSALRTQRVERRILMDRPWHLLDELAAALSADLDASEVPPAPRGDAAMPAIRGEQLVRIADDVRFDSPAHTLILADQGPVVIDRGAHIGAMTVLEGPCCIGPRSVVAHHTSIRPNTVIGPGCKVAGEISHSILHGYTNKAHHGYLGHSLVGQWVNLGAATNVSNLKNTYGRVRVQLEPDSAPEDTGRNFHGPIIGDFVRTAISTRLTTGSCLGTGAMIAVGGFAPKFAERFSFHTDKGAARYDIQRFLQTARAMMARRDKPMPDALEARLRTLASPRVVV